MSMWKKQHPHTYGRNTILCSHFDKNLAINISKRLIMPHRKPILEHQFKRKENMLTETGT
jgi:hypothetical protein